MNKQFVIFRHGSNSYNQSMTQTMPVCIVEAKDSHQAKVIALETVKVFNNQWLEARFLSRCKLADIQEAREVQEARQYHLDHINDLVEQYTA